MEPSLGRLPLAKPREMLPKMTTGMRLTTDSAAPSQRTGTTLAKIGMPGWPGPRAVALTTGLSMQIRPSMSRFAESSQYNPGTNLERRNGFIPKDRSGHDCLYWYFEGRPGSQGQY